MKIDGKFSCDGTRLFNTMSGVDIPQEEPRFLLRGRDRNSLKALRSYRLACEEDGCNELHMAAIDKNISAFENFSLTYAERMKEPGSTRHVNLEAI